MIKEFFSSFNFDIRIHKDARFMDQKCTPDVVCIIADCIINYVENNHYKKFDVKDIWDSQYFIKNVKAIFNKPLATNPTTKSEYDKFIQQPLRMLAHAKILNIEKSGNKNIYQVNNYQILEYISLKDRNAYIFLNEYLTKVLTDSGLIKYFIEYKNYYENGNTDNEMYNYLKEKFQKFIIGNTNINTTIEVNRIFPKILNVYACNYNIVGSLKGSVSKHPFYYTELMYNKKNWRDAYKDKNISRQEDIEYKTNTDIDNHYSNYLIQKAMNQIRKMYIESEVKDSLSNTDATQVHHIFPKHQFPQLAHYLENLIKLTASQHYSRAHPNNKTQDICKDYQLICLLAKSDSIEKSILKKEPYYRKESFIYCINEGLSLNNEFTNDLSFTSIKSKLSYIYNDL